MQWRHSGSPPPKKAKTAPSAGKVMRMESSGRWPDGQSKFPLTNRGIERSWRAGAELVTQLCQVDKKKASRVTSGNFLHVVQAMIIMQFDFALTNVPEPHLDPGSHKDSTLGLAINFPVRSILNTVDVTQKCSAVHVQPGLHRLVGHSDVRLYWHRLAGSSIRQEATPRTFYRRCHQTVPHWNAIWTGCPPPPPWNLSISTSLGGSSLLSNPSSECKPLRCQALLAPSGRIIHTPGGNAPHLLPQMSPDCPTLECHLDWLSTPTPLESVNQHFLGGVQSTSMAAALQKIDIDLEQQLYTPKIVDFAARKKAGEQPLPSNYWKLEEAYFAEEIMAHNTMPDKDVQPPYIVKDLLICVAARLQPIKEPEGMIYNAFIFAFCRDVTGFPALEGREDQVVNLDPWEYPDTLDTGNT
ncbi:hypothetical protein LAZ67_9002560 [Cordylochernes scorpioides]|uniref:Uncharacterized protein n=1 Tax=Cordylochernes scorpioides TaxID=51811 RepID=A0ABY6KUD7_9ARAC|nr:hypothetical protein LAZ67_9002560 [Cordylochernes scorpioides]